MKRVDQISIIIEMAKISILLLLTKTELSGFLLLLQRQRNSILAYQLPLKKLHP